MEDINALKLLEEELYGINNAVSKTQERLNIVEQTESTLNKILGILSETRDIAQDSYDTKYNQITENILKLEELAKKIQFNELNEFNKDEIIPQGAIAYNFNNINYNSLIMCLPKTPPISKNELKNFIQEVNSRYSNISLQVSQLKSYKNKLELIINNLSVTALACYLGS